MVTTIFTAGITVLSFALKIILEFKAGKKLTNKEYADTVLAHQEQRDGAGATTINWRKNLNKLKARMVKKKKNNLKK